MTQRYYYLLRIEGVASVDGQLAACWPAVPDYASGDGEYIAALREPPSPAGAQWDLVAGSVSTGRWSVILDPDAMGVALRAVTPIPLTEIRDADALTILAGIQGMTAADGTMSHAMTNAEAGIAVDDVLYLGTETVLVTAATAGLTTCSITRGYGGSTAVEHPYGSDIFVSPPALVGRRMTLYRTPVDAADDTQETVIADGYIHAEPAWGYDGMIGLEALCALRNTMLGSGPVSIDLITSENGLAVTLYDPTSGRPPGNASGGYWYHKSMGVVIPTLKAGLTWSTAPHATTTWGTIRDLGDSESGACTQILLSDVDQPYPAYRYYDVDADEWYPSDHPAVITLCSLMSLDGANYDVGDDYHYDLGDLRTTDGGLYPYYSPGVPRELVDVDAFVDLWQGELSEIRAPMLWVGGGRAVSVHELLRQLWAPLGYVVGTTSAGVWTIWRLTDSYPGNNTTTIPSNADGSGLSVSVISRALRGITLPVSPGPDGEATGWVRITEDDGARYYHEPVGQVEDLEPAPYRYSDYQEADSYLYAVLLGRIRWLSGRMMAIRSLGIGPDLYDEVDVGGAVILSDLGLWPPETGARISSGSTISGMVTAMRRDSYTRQSTIDVAVTSGLHIGLWSHAATVESWDAGAKEHTVTEHAWTQDGDGDGARFTAGDIVHLVDSHLALLSTAPATVASVTDTTIVLTALWDAGATTPVAGDIVVAADYDSQAARQTGLYASCADGGAPASGIPDLGAGDAAPYVYGD